MPIEISTSIVDEGLSILDEMSNAELEVLVRIIVDKGKLTEQLTSKKEFKQFYPDHRRYLALIAKELIAFGSHTFYFKKPYVEIVRDVCDKMDVPYDKSHSLTRLEQNLLSKVLERTWESMSDLERREFLDSVGQQGLSVGKDSADILIGLFQSGGSPAVPIALSIVGSISEMLVAGSFQTLMLSTGGSILVESGATLITNAVGSRVVSLLTGPIGIALTTAFTLKTIGGPAYRVTVPAVIYIAGMRMLYANRASLPRGSESPVNLRRSRQRQQPLADKIYLGFGWKVDQSIALDVVAFVLDVRGLVSSNDDLVFYNQPKHPTGALEWSEDMPSGDHDVERFYVDFTRLPTEVRSIKFFVVIDGGTFAQAKDINVRIVDELDRESRRRTLSGDFSLAASIELGELVRHDDAWFFNLIQRGSDMGLAALCERFGVYAE